MHSDRRTFMKTTAAGLASAAAPLAPGSAAAAQAAKAPPVAFEMPRNMTLLNMRTAAGPRLGVKQPRGVLDVAAAAAMYKMPAPVDTDDLLQHGKGGLLARVVAAAAEGPARLYLQESAIQHAPLVTRPEKIIMMGFNYRRHAAETGTPIPANPILFNKFNSALNHHGGTIALPAVASHFDHEIELVIVFGRECRNVSEADALDYVAGYCTGNDFTARDLQYLTTQFMIGKTFDGFAPLGPHLVTSDLVGDPNNLKLECRINGGAASGLEHQRHDLQLPADDQLRLADDDHQARRHPLHRHTARCDLRQAQGRSGVAQGRRPRGLQRGKARRAGVQPHVRRRAPSRAMSQRRDHDAPPVESLQPPGIELHSIDYVPAAERHGTVRHLGAFWFVSSVNLTGLARR